MATCSIAFHKMEKWYECIVRWLHYLAPVADLAARLWVARIFWMAGMVKLQSMTATVALFRYYVSRAIASSRVGSLSGYGH